MQEIAIFQVDAFSGRIFGGNPAAVCPLMEFPDDTLMQSIARENNLSETAFLVRCDDEEADYRLRWFTPAVEVELCGHATLAAGFVVMKHYQPDMKKVRFLSHSGVLTVTCQGDVYCLDFPVVKPAPVDLPQEVRDAFTAKIIEAERTAREYILRLESVDDVQNEYPDQDALRAIGEYGFVITAEGEDGVDFVSRCFYPNHGVPEDPVTGSAHCVLAPFWQARLKKSSMHALQISVRGGELWLEIKGDRTIIKGRATQVMQGSLMIPSEQVYTNE